MAGAHVHGHHTHLKRELGLAEATFYGLGIIIGAGIFVLLGSGAGLAGNAVWLSFVMAAAIAALTGLSYCELSSRYPHEAAEYLYLSKAFKSRALPFLIGWILIFTAAFSASTVALGFAGYFFKLFGAMPHETALILIAFLSFVNFMGIKGSARMSIAFTLLEMAALFIIIGASAPFLGSVDYTATASGGIAQGFGGVAAAASLLFFAYIGFDTIPKISDETRKASSTIPRAMLYSLVISILLYVAVSLSAVSVLPWYELAASSAPLTDVALAAAGPLWGSAVSVLALFATLSTVLIVLIAGSRMIYGMANENALPSILAVIHRKRCTPHTAVFAIMLLSMVFVYAGSIELLARLTTIGMFIVFIFINAALIKVRMKHGMRAPFTVPLNAGKIPVLAVFGIAASLFLALQFEPAIYVYEGVLAAAGIVTYFLLESRKKRRHGG